MEQKNTTSRSGNVANSYFSDKELACRCGKCDSSNKMDMVFMSKLNMLRLWYGKPIILSSAYRCPEYNKQVSTTGLNGPHTTGKAVDILVSGEDAYKIVELAFDFGFTGIGIKQLGDNNKRFIHLDTVPYPRPRIWSY